MSHIPPKGIVSSKVHSSKRFSSLKSLNIDLGYIKVGDVADSKCLIEDVFGDGEAYRAVGYLLMDSPSPATDTQLSHSSFTTGRAGVCGKLLNGISLFIKYFRCLLMSGFGINIPYYAF